MPAASLRRIALAVAAALVAAIALTAPGSAAFAASCSSTRLNVVAHPDDDLFFQSPDLLAAISAGGCVTTAYVTAGDDGDTQTYWAGRQNGVQAAYAKMAGVANSWTSSPLTLGGKTVASVVLAGRTGIRLVYLRLPDGGMTGAGFSSTGNTSLKQLLTGQVSTIAAVDGSASYTAATLQSTLLALMNKVQPGEVDTQDFVGTYGDGDHADHHAVADVVQAASGQYTTPHTLTGYQDYGIQDKAENLTSAQVSAKSAAYYAYAAYDSKICASDSACAGQPEAAWLKRQYTVSQSASVGTNVAPQASVSASSQNTATGQTAAAAVDGTVDGYPGDYTKEWATVGQGAGATLTLSWSAAQRIDRITLFDRPNTSDRITSGRLTFSDGSVVAVPSLSDDGTGTTVSFSARSVTSVQLTVLSVSSTTTNVGLAEIQAWTATGSSGGGTGTAASNVAAASTATASSENTADGQGASAAIDGVVDGYPGDYTREWATKGGGAGSWLQLTWSSAQTLTRAVLYDRPNTNDQVTSGHLLFSDGTTVAVGALDNGGAATTVDFAARSATSMRFVVDSVSGTTQNVGLAELQAWIGTTSSGGSTPAPTASPSATLTPIPTPTPTPTSSPTASATPTASPTVSPTPATSPTATASPTPTPTPTSSLPTGTNVALTSMATASSQATGQGAAKAIDGRVTGYPADSTGEWATSGGKAGSWLKLTWSAAKTVNAVVLYDRPNSDDQIMAAKLTFSNGTTVTVPALANDGSATTVRFTAVATTSVRLDVTTVSGTTLNVGLAEMGVYAP